jgi:hypothetical protein
MLVVMVRRNIFGQKSKSHRIQPLVSRKFIKMSNEETKFALLYDQENKRNIRWLFHCSTIISRTKCSFFSFGRSEELPFFYAVIFLFLVFLTQSNNFMLNMFTQLSILPFFLVKLCVILKICVERKPTDKEKASNGI